MQRIRPFTYFNAETVADAVRVLAAEGEGAYALAGGTDLLVQMKSGALRPRVLVNLKRIASLNSITKAANGDLHIGALVPLSGIEHSALVRESHPVLAEAAGSMASPSIRNMATIGGNIGRASPASDMAPSLIVLGARALVEGNLKKREIAVEDFCTAPGKTVLKAGELITGFVVPAMARTSGAVYKRAGRRDGMDCTLAGVAVLLALANDGAVKDARIALSAVAAIPTRARRAEEMLRSGVLTGARMKEAAHAAAADDACPISDVRASDSYRRSLVEVLTYRGLAQALERAKGAAS
jgi:aerobic carbon-monoxide dehydrogenase medium subunit